MDQMCHKILRHVKLAFFFFTSIEYYLANVATDCTQDVITEYFVAIAGKPHTNQPIDLTNLFLLTRSSFRHTFF